MKRKQLVTLLNNKLIQNVLYSWLLDYYQWSILRFVKQCAVRVEAGDTLIDVGAGEQKYKMYFSRCKYTSQDLCVGNVDCNFKNIDTISSAYDIPVRANSFDNIFCSQELERLKCPDRTFTEFIRILKTGGRLFLSAPLGSGEHQIPYDYCRFTQDALKSLGEKHRLKPGEIKPAGRMFIGLEYVFRIALEKLISSKHNRTFGCFIHFLLLLVKMIVGLYFRLLGVFDFDKRYTLNYSCVYGK